MENAKFMKSILSNFQTMFKVKSFVRTWLTNFGATTADLTSVEGRFYTQHLNRLFGPTVVGPKKEKLVYFEILKIQPLILEQEKRNPTESGFFRLIAKSVIWPFFSFVLFSFQVLQLNITIMEEKLGDPKVDL